MSPSVVEFDGTKTEVVAEKDRAVLGAVVEVEGGAVDIEVKVEFVVELEGTEVRTVVERDGTEVEADGAEVGVVVEPDGAEVEADSAGDLRGRHRGRFIGF
uniref:Uncharacterized protein n=1 Tax=Panagrolaimus sp. ES5 TaxID=591445 RepID=A0AC34FXI4_9BILA